ncbi:UDP-glucuronate:xylan alpha-glucuronosyltransferase 2 [Capsicum baccatum]|uniref:UDP-glucuronate:xylan alpha-glucuronosyltransferase 2 n=1 Tax=Capsicum baccatum TaxID=33114 RepID=A0A2G2VHN5_CAPBA|nr:UDP-glucuronate:xylan alpha-glucuronosyltransferase 2 [Capsicum baccatum]
MKDENISNWNMDGHIIIPTEFDKISYLIEWKDLFPSWIDEEEEKLVPTCPKLPMPNFSNYSANMDMIVAKLPCNYPKQGSTRDVFRLQVHLVVANLVAKREGNWDGKRKVVFFSKCRPMVELFRCDDLVKHEGDWWYYEVDVAKLAKGLDPCIVKA